MSVAAYLLLAAVGVGLIVWGAESFAENLARASVRLGVSAFALAILLAGAEPEELATSVTASLRHVSSIAIGDVIGANVTICLVALAVGAWFAPLPFTVRVRRYAAAGLPCGLLAAALAWSGRVTRLEGAVLVAAYVVFVAVIWIVERETADARRKWRARAVPRLRGPRRPSPRRRSLPPRRGTSGLLHVRLTVVELDHAA